MQRKEQISSEDLLAEETFINYLLNSNGKDVAYWKAWINEHPENDAAVAEAKELFFALRPPASSDRNAPIPMEEFRNLLNLEPELTAGKNNRTWLRIAAAAAVLFVVAGAWWFTANRQAPAMAYYSNHENNSKEVMLPDGTRVLLNADAAISIPADYNASTRQVTLEGAAFFHVAKNPDKPLTVSANGIATTAIGTAFYIHRNPTTEKIQVSLLEGKVKIANGNQLTYLKPGEEASCSPTTIVVSTFDSAQLSNWTRKKIEFNKAGLPEIARTLETYFNYRVTITGTQKETAFTGRFDVDHPIEILESLKFTYNIQYTVRNNQLTLFVN
ncbi:FecR family protein [Flavihumibacter petaseus]|uniref:Putative anti-sigma factor n=1 Tax=Flavihumibacter petaseus NBRC 106054 TaxID=1220578 RepID=A0A0E9MW49_9BACT|nr:FecR domain-containing protein [Flavihumibacter petaseus]GAO41350.1 putative anti-sigma factor [Flavihumibacter petaseus NBRC 106054]